MQIPSILALAAFGGSALAQVTCARAPGPLRNVGQTGYCIRQRDGLSVCGRGSAVQVWYAPPSNGGSSGVLRIRNSSPGTRYVVQIDSNEPQVVFFWINGGDECTTNLGFPNLGGYSATYDD